MITAEQITQFKSASDENTIIAHILRHEFLSNLKEPILDVGAGVGDIASSAFNDKEAILLDILEFEDYQSNELHKRVKKRFFLAGRECNWACWDNTLLSLSAIS